MVNGYNKLPDKLYTTMVPLLATYDEEEIDIFGLPVDVDNGKYNKTYDKMVKVKIPIDTMIDYYSSGYKIAILNPKDSIEIFEILEDYISGKSNIRRSINVQEVRDPRLDEIDKFVTEMFDRNKAKIVEDAMDFKDGFDIGINVMAQKSMRSEDISDVKRGGRLGINGVYNSKPKNDYGSHPTTTQASYVPPSTEDRFVPSTAYPGSRDVQPNGNFDNQPNIDLSKIKRTSTLKHRQDVDYNKGR